MAGSAIGFGLVAQIHFYTFVLAGFLGIAVTLWGLANTEKQATVEFATFTGSSSLWVFIVAAQIAAGPQHQYPLHLLASVLKVFAIGTWFWFTLTYTGYRDQLNMGAWIGYGLFAGIVLAAIITDPMVGLAFGERMLQTTPFAIAEWQSGPVGILIPAFTYGSFALGTLGLAYRFHGTGYAKTWQAPFLLLLNLLFIFIDNIGGVFVLFSDPVNYTAVAAPLTGALYYLVLYRHDVLGFAPVARQAIFEEMSDIAVVVNPKDKIVDHNEAAAPLLPDRDDVIGEHVDDILPEELATIIRDDEAPDEPVQLTIDGDTRYYEASVSDVSTSKGTSGTVLTLGNVTRTMEQQFRLEKQKEELRQQRDELERQNERLDKFASTVAHDLRNPLTVAQTYAMQLDKEVDSEHVDTVKDSLTRMDDMVEEILTLARQGATVENMEEISLASVAEDEFKYADTKDATLHTVGDTTFHADPDRLDNFFGNLFRNSVDHGPDDVDIYVEPTEDGFAIEDTGPGIPEEEQDSVFDHGFTTSDEGTGFGLSIVKEIADAHGWEITTTDGHRSGGARFEITLPDDPQTD